MATRWQRVADDIREQIRSGELRPGDQIPSYRQLAERWGWSKPTIRQALSVLQAEGWISGEQGVGNHVREDHPA